MAHFGLEELAELCTDLGVDIENLGGSGKAAKARELVAWCQQRDCLQRLAEALGWQPTQQQGGGYEKRPDGFVEQRSQGSPIVVNSGVRNGNINAQGRDVVINGGVVNGDINNAGTVTIRRGVINGDVGCRVFVHEGGVVHGDVNETG